MKLLIFAHTPPPFHGQSYMVKLLLEGLQHGTHRSEANLRVYHVDAKLSSSLEAIGKFQWSKVFLILKYCAQAYWHRFVHGANVLYYVPAPGLRAAVYRDWIVMFFCRPLFKKTIFHWHAAGLAEWTETAARNWEKQITHWLLDDVDLSIVLSEFNRADAQCFSPRALSVVPNGIPDPCPDFETTVLPDRRERLLKRHRGEKTTFTILFVGACTAAKGLFATLDAVSLMNRRFLERRARTDLRLVVAGDFASEEERRRFNKHIAEPDLIRESGTSRNETVVYKGFVIGSEKGEVFRHADVLCFPSQYSAEGQPVAILEALAFGLPVVATRWRAIPELLAGSGSRLIDNQDPAGIADSLEELATEDVSRQCRQIFLERYRVDQYLTNLIDAFSLIASDRTVMRS